jgi:hypothetical protein
MARILAVFLFLALQLQAAVGVRLIMGLTDRQTARWDGSVTVDRGRITGIDGWRFEANDEISGNSWKMSTRSIRLFGAAKKGQPPVVANGVIVWVDAPEDRATLEVKTAQGNFRVSLADIPYGKSVRALDGRVFVDRVPPAAQLTRDGEEQDYPAAAVDKSGAIWVAYVEFKHHPEHNRIRANYQERPKNFDDLKAPTGGDRILVQRIAGATPDPPIAISEPGGDVYRPAVAVDGAGKVWVFWSANQKGDFDLWARPVEGGKAGVPVRLTSAPDADVFPVAATDTTGRVWVAWQGWRNGRAAIFAAVQEGTRFSAPVAVSASSGNEWNPAIAAGPGGRVTVAWDSYRNGNYDIYARTASAPGKWGPERPLVHSRRYEAYPSIAYDNQNRLWLAYEEGAENWGKDFGAYETTGIAIYQGRAVRLVAFDANGGAVEAVGRPGMLMPGPPQRQVENTGAQDEVRGWLEPDPEASKNRAPSATPRPPLAPKNSMPRLAVDPSGRLWLAFRSAHPVWWNPIGTVWTEYVISCAGAECTGPVYLHRTDNLLDNRPAIVTPKPGVAVVIGSSDNRRQFEPATRARTPRAAAARAEVGDPYQNDLWMNTIVLEPARGPVQAKAAELPKPAGVVVDQKEQAAIAAIRNYRMQSPREGTLRILSGEFHRHSEISGDGGGDGTILDQFRYAIDAAHMDWVGCCDHDNGGGREYSWWTTQKLTDILHSPGRFIPMFSYERSVTYPEGHRNVVFAQRGIRPLPRLPRVSEDQPGKAPDTLMLYDYLRTFNGIAASHTSATNMGTDWRDNDPNVEPVVEIYQGDRQNYEMPDAPRSNSEKDSIGGWRPKGFVSLALEMGYKLGFQASSDHISTHMSYCNLYVKDASREAIMDAFRKRHVYGATDNILADVRSGPYMMGDVFTTSSAPELRVKLVGTAPFAKVHIIKDNKYVYTSQPNTASVEFTWRDNAPVPGKQSYYYVRGEQEDGEIVWVSPMWITYKKN